MSSQQQHVATAAIIFPAALAAYLPSIFTLRSNSNFPHLPTQQFFSSALQQFCFQSLTDATILLVLPRSCYPLYNNFSLPLYSNLFFRAV
jgi:hypothetical protein